MYRDIKDILNKTVKNPVTGCLEWPGKPMNKGYIYVSYKSKKVLLHRLVYQEYIDEIPDGLQVLHTCDNRICCNPEHLFLGTNFDNVQDKVRKGRTLIKEPKTHVSLNLMQAEEIRKLYSEGTSQIKLSRLFDVHLRTIQGVINKTTRRLILEGVGSDRLGEV